MKSEETMETVIELFKISFGPVTLTLFRYMKKK